MTQQNAANAEESASAAEELSSQSEQLSSMVGDLVRLVGGADGRGHEHVSRESSTPTSNHHHGWKGKPKLREVLHRASMHDEDAFDDSDQKAANF